MELFNTIGSIASTIVTLGALLAMVSAPVRKKLKEWILDTADSDEIKEHLKGLDNKVDTIVENLNGIQSEMKVQKKANQSLLRSKITETYYRNLDKETLREFEAKALHKNYEAYKDEDGNSFIDTIYKTMCDWKIIP